jgi:hypothetical protein
MGIMMRLELVDKAVLEELLAERAYDPDNDFNMPRCSHVRWLERTTVCASSLGFVKGGCRSPAGIEVDGSPLCLVHALHALIRILAKEEDESRDGSCNRCFGTESNRGSHGNSRHSES